MVKFESGGDSVVFSPIIPWRNSSLCKPRPQDKASEACAGQSCVAYPAFEERVGHGSIGYGGVQG